MLTHSVFSTEQTPPEQATPPSPLLALGDVYAAYVDCIPDHQPQWIRARLLVVETANDDQVTVLAVDYGYIITVAKEYLMGLPPRCRGIPPQVRREALVDRYR